MSEEGPSSAKLAWMRVLERHKQSECQLSQEDTVPDAQLRTTAKTQSIRQKQDKRKALYLVAGRNHSVWTPRQRSLKQQGFTDVVIEAVKSKQDLKERQKRLRSRVMATQLVLKVQREAVREEGGGEEEEVQTPKTEKKMWQRVIKKVMEENTKVRRKKRSKRSLHFHDVVSRYVEKMERSTSQDEETVQSTTLQAKADARRALRQWRSQYLGKPMQPKRSSSLKQFSSLSNIEVRQPPAEHHATITEANEESSL